MEFMRSNFVAEAVVAELRAGNYPSDQQAESLDRRPLIDGLRKQIDVADIPWVLRLISHESPKVAGLACSLARHHMNDPRVRLCLENQWLTASPYLKNRIMWRLLDVPELPAHWRERFVDLIRSEWRVFCDFNRVFFNPPESALAQIASRLLDSSFPETKKWVYLYCVPTVNTTASLAAAVLHLGLSVKDEFAQTLARQLLDADTPDVAQNPVEMPVGQPGFSFIAEAVLSALREKNLPAEIECEALNCLPIIDEMRIEIQHSDLQWIWPVIKSENGKRAGLFLSLLRQYSCRADVQDWLRARWETASPFLRAHLMWRILDDPNLPLEWHEKLFQFVLTEWEAFHEISLKFLGTPKTVVVQVLKRIADPSFPNSKKWAYLCRVPHVADDSEAAKAIILLGAFVGDNFAQKVSGELLKRFFEPSHTGDAAYAGLS